MKRTEKQIQSMITVLTEIKRHPNFRKVTFFGDNNVAAIDAQIKTLEKRLTEDDVCDLEDRGTFSDHEASSARDAANWLAGDDEDDPAKGWEGLY